MKKKILDIMIDFETFGRQPESVPINFAVVAWNRYAEENPFVIPGVKSKSMFSTWESAAANLPLVRKMGMPLPSINLVLIFGILIFVIALLMA